MARTPEEEAELQILLSMEEADSVEEEGRQAIQRVQERPQRPARAQPTLPFSFRRVTIGGLRDAAQGVIDTLYDVTEGAFRNPMGTLSPFTAPIAAAGALSIASGADRVTLPDLNGTDRAGTAEKVTRSIVSFVAPFAGSLRAASSLRAVALLGRPTKAAEGLATAREFNALGRAAQGAAAGIITDFSQLDPVSGNIVNTMRDVFGLDNAMVDALASDPDEDTLDQRFKAAVAGAGVGLLADGVMTAGGKLLQLYKGWRGTADEAAAVVESIKQGPVEIKLRNAAEDSTLNTPVGQSAAAAGKAAKAKPKTKEVPANAIIAGEKLNTLDDVARFLKKKVAGGNTDPELIARLGRELIEGDPEKALTEMGLDPLKLDYSKITDADQLQRLLAGMEDVFLRMAERLGRTGKRVTEKVLIRGAQGLASTPDTLRTLYENTGHLAEKLLAGRLIVGAHAHRLLADADLAAKELEAGDPGEAWNTFLQSFYRHALFMGTVRGAGSEVGRALRSLQFLAKVSPKNAQRILSETLESDAKAATAQATGKVLDLPTGASVFADTLETNAQKLEALRRLMKNGGDVEELSRKVREGAGRKGSRISEIVKESMGNLWTINTGGANTIAGLGMLGTNALGKWAAAAVRYPTSFVTPALKAEYIRAKLEAWAYTEPLISAWGAATRNTLGVLERELLLEASLNADAMGLRAMAKGLQIKAAKAAGEITEHFERADIVTNKAIAFHPNELTKLSKDIANLSAPEFFKRGLTGLLRSAAVPANAAGTLSRAGTTLFINAPDEFVGTIATRAGAQAAAVRFAAAEAAELGLEGPQLAQFIKARAIQLYGDGPGTWGEAAEEIGASHVMARAGEAEANMVLFKDNLELKFNRSVANLQVRGGPLVSMVVPIIRTPLRILERAAFDYTPIGLLRERFWTAIKAGGSQRDEAITRLSLGMIMVATAYQLAEDRRLVGRDGGTRSSARDAGRLPYTIELGGDYYEYSRVDPAGILLGLGADLREAIEASGDDPEAGNMAEEIFKALTFGVAANILNKSWLTSIKNLTDLAGATSSDDGETRWKKFVATFGNRVVPGAGIQRAVQQLDDPFMREAMSFSEGLIKTTIGGDRLPVKRNVIGRPVENQAMGQIGLRGAFVPDAETDPVMTELEALSFPVPEAARVQKGVRLNATQFSRFLELRGQVVRHPTTGLTMEESLRTIIAMPEYQAMSKSQRVLELQGAMNGFTHEAAEALTKEDQSFAYARLRDEVFVLSNKQGWDAQQREAALADFAQQLGIKPK